MDHFYQKYRILAIISLIITFILFIWQSIGYMDVFIKDFSFNGDYFFYSFIYNIFGWIQFIATCICLLLLNFMIIQNKRDKIKLLILIIFGLVLSGLFALTRLDTLINSIYFSISYNVPYFGQILKQFILLLLSLSLFIINLDQFKYIIKFLKNETAD